MNKPVDVIVQIYKERKKEFFHANELLKNMEPGHYAYEILIKMSNQLGSALYGMVEDCPELLDIDNLEAQQ